MLAEILDEATISPIEIFSDPALRVVSRKFRDGLDIWFIRNTGSIEFQTAGQDLKIKKEGLFSIGPNCSPNTQSFYFPKDLSDEGFIRDIITSFGESLEAEFSIREDFTVTDKGERVVTVEIIEPGLLAQPEYRELFLNKA